MHPILPLHGYRFAHDLPLELESLGHLLAVLGNGEAVASQSEMRRDETIRRAKALGGPWGCKPLHPPFLLPGRLGGIFRPITEGAVLPKFHTGQRITREEDDGKYEVCYETC